MIKKIKIAIIGASGYTGAELIRLLLQHPNAEIQKLIANSNANQSIENIYPHLKNFNLPILSSLEEVNFAEIDLAFCCMPHSTTQEIVNKIKFNELGESINNHLKIIDLSADFRIKNANEYQKWYNHEHIALNLQENAVYGLSEINRDKIKKSPLIACPGCYPTSALLPLIPLLKNGIISPKNIIIDSKSGATGAGRALKQGSLFCEVNDNIKAYNIGSHRHIGEIKQELENANNLSTNTIKEDIEFEFTPHLLPINRGIISTIYTTIHKNITIEDVNNCLETFYQDEYFVNLVDHEPSIKEVIGTNFCLISVKPALNPNKIIIISVIDNLCKGAAGQAVQNMNIAFGLDERSGLSFSPLFP